MRKPVTITVNVESANVAAEANFKAQATKILENLTPENIAFLAQVAVMPKANDRLKDKQGLIHKYVATGKIF